MKKAVNRNADLQTVLVEMPTYHDDTGTDVARMSPDATRVCSCIIHLTIEDAIVHGMTAAAMFQPALVSSPHI